ncbi:hypothetical protein ACBJ59_10735 [Nonomuraea sp. MTCD27]|uniref:hypothetical protein n=1 Tax=Nonomuraea sp. MTCD27 TaxID=1676747 RepID=UPI0035C14398
MRNSITVGGHEVAVDQGEYETFDDDGNLVTRATGHSTWWCTCGVKGAGPNVEAVRELCDHLGIDENGELITMTDLDAPLAAVERIDWTKVTHVGDEEYYRDWLWIDDKVHMADDPDAHAVVEFMQQAPAELRRLAARVRELEVRDRGE